MSNPFQTSELLKSASNYPVRKGDLPGHAFHGNQYQQTATGSSREALGLAKGAKATADEGASNPNRIHEDAAQAHGRAAEALRQIAKDTALSDPERQGILRLAIGAHEDAMFQHLAAADANSRLDDNGYNLVTGNPDDIEYADTRTQEALEASQHADNATFMAVPKGDYTVAATNPDGTNTVIAQVTHDSIGY